MTDTVIKCACIKKIVYKSIMYPTIHNKQFFFSFFFGKEQTVMLPCIKPNFDTIASLSSKKTQESKNFTEKKGQIVQLKHNHPIHYLGVPTAFQINVQLAVNYCLVLCSPSALLNIMSTPITVICHDQRTEEGRGREGEINCKLRSN